jgi:hypothetical protein
LGWSICFETGEGGDEEIPTPTASSPCPSPPEEEREFPPPVCGGELFVGVLVTLLSFG